MKKARMRYDIITLFPEAFSSVLTVSILKRAIEAGELEFVLHDVRQYADDAHRTVDDTPYGGGAGMVMKPAPIFNAVRDVPKVSKKMLRVFFTPQGEPLTQKVVRELATYDQIVMLCGHYEGVDQRVRDSLIDREISLGDYVLTGGELPSMVVCDAVARLVGGVLGNPESHKDETFEKKLLEYPQYTRPAEFEGLKVPEVLRAGHHKKIKKWRDEQSYNKTKRVRPDLIK
jgi:tRNA (guanine37-N1)-methyltransferase